jgi:hypothetical protein
VNITIIDDGVFEDDETITLTLTTEDLSVNVGNNVTTLTIEDNDGWLPLNTFRRFSNTIYTLHRGHCWVPINGD